MFLTINDCERLMPPWSINPHLEALTLPLDSLGWRKGWSFWEMHPDAVKAAPLKRCSNSSGKMSGGIAVDHYLRFFWSNGVGLAL
jgi:hypothetical protein